MPKNKNLITVEDDVYSVRAKLRRKKPSVLVRTRVNPESEKRKKRILKKS
jgi:hypothetical protein